MAEEGRGWLSRLKAGLSRSSSRLTDGVAGILKTRRLDAASLQEIEELLLSADLGPAMAAKLTQALAKERFGGEASAEAVRESMAATIAQVLAPLAKPLAIDPEKKPFTVLVVGVNGTGKTTTIGKLARLYGGAGLKVVLCAADTFRAAAIDQLKIWGERAGAEVFAREQGADAAALVFDSLKAAREEGADLLLIDTAGRLHNRADLMAELEKLRRVMRKSDPSAPHAVLLVLDATTGQNALAQVETFRAIIEVSGLIVTKLDGSAKGGVLVSLAERFGLPIHAIGVGEGADDLRPFRADDFARSLMGLES